MSTVVAFKPACVTVEKEITVEKKTESVVAPVAPTPAPTRPAKSALVVAVSELLFKVVPPVLGLALVIGIWGLFTMNGGSIPTPLQVWAEAVKLFSDPFYSNGPNDQGIGWNVLS